MRGIYPENISTEPGAKSITIRKTASCGITDMFLDLKQLPREIPIETIDSEGNKDTKMVAVNEAGAAAFSCLEAKGIRLVCLIESEYEAAIATIDQKGWQEILSAFITNQKCPGFLTTEKAVESALDQWVNEFFLADGRGDRGGIAIADVLLERERQDSKWGEQNHDPITYLAILGEEYGEACRAAIEARFDGAGVANLRTELVQTAAVALAMVQCIDREKWAWPKQKIQEGCNES